jgi:hypothetical protein
MFGLRCWRLMMAAVCLVGTAGCGARPVPVKGIVIFDDKPLANAAVEFHPEAAGGRDATGFTDANGAFELTTLRSKDGALPGSYKVTVRFSEPASIPVDMKTAASVQKSMAEATKSRQPSIVIPDIYRQVDQTPLQCKLPEDRNVKLELRSEPR